MDGPDNQPAVAQLERELAYYRRECNDLGARLLRLQEEQSEAFREARRSRTVAKLIREAYRLSDAGNTPESIGGPLLEVVVENALCDRAAFLERIGDRSEPPRFRMTNAIGLVPDAIHADITVPIAPTFFFTTSRTPIETPAYEITAILGVPYVLWCWDRPSGHALIIGNRAEGNVTRPFGPADQELIEGALSVYIDVLTRKRGDVELRVAKAAAEDASAMRARFLATFSHELRTPLNAIIGFSELLISHERLLPEQRRSFADQILQSGRNLLALINDILDYSQLARLAPQLALDWHLGETVLGAAADEAVGVALNREISVILEPVAPGVRLQVDRRRFHQVLNNLLGNALKFTPAGGNVTLGLRMLDDGGAVITVRDTGVGMRPEDVPRALQPFEQLESGHDRNFAGTGLGLPIARGLMEAHLGTLDIESVPGEGTTVILTLPPERVRTTPT